MELIAAREMNLELANEKHVDFQYSPSGLHGNLSYPLLLIDFSTVSVVVKICGYRSLHLWHICTTGLLGWPCYKKLEVDVD